LLFKADILEIWENLFYYFCMMKRKIINLRSFALLVLVCFCGIGSNITVLFSQSSKPKTGIDFINEGMAAYQKKDYRIYLEKLEKAYRVIPGYSVLMYYLSSAHALNGQKKEALNWLKKVVSTGLYFPIAGDSDFNSLKDSSQFNALLEKLEVNKRPIKNSKIAFKIKEKDLIPEGITYNPKNKTFYISSIYKRKIIAVGHDGKKTDFIASKQDDFWGGVGIKVDVHRQLLWANNRVGNHMMGYNEKEVGLAAISKYHIADKKLIKKYVLPDGQAHLLNDIAIHDNGSLYITDTETGAIYTISPEKDRLELFIKTGNFLYPNGITLSDDQMYLFVAHLEGIARIHLQNKKIVELDHGENILLNGVDGLYFYNGSLVAIQNDSGLNRAVRFHLNENYTGVEKMTVLDSYHPLYNIPTTGVIVEDEFYYIANSQMGSFTPDNKIFPMEKLNEVIILKVSLDN